MTKFKRGDRVRVISSGSYILKNQIGEVQYVYKSTAYIIFNREFYKKLNSAPRSIPLTVWSLQKEMVVEEDPKFLALFE